MNQEVASMDPHQQDSFTESTVVTNAPRTLKGRVAISFKLEVSGEDLEGRNFVDEARTMIVGRNGAAIVIDRLLAPEQTVTIKRVGTRQDAEVRVIGLIGSEAGSKIYGISFLVPAASFWGLDFPAGDTDEPLVNFLLECPGCHTRQIVPLGELELSVFEATQHLSRLCRKCRDVTFWKQSLYDVPPEPESASTAPPVKATQPELAPAPKVFVNPRKHRRVKVQLKGCILFGGQETPVQVTDMSRGGVRLRSARSFADGLLVRIAAPYNPGAANIFVSARICWCRALPCGMSECGLKYVKD